MHWAVRTSRHLSDVSNTHHLSYLCRFDWNKYFGRNGKSFVDEHEAPATSFVNAFREYALENLSGDEADDVKDDSTHKAPTKVSNIKPDIQFKRNSFQEPLLPPDSLDLKLEEKKHIFRCFLKSKYGESTCGPELITM